MPEINNSSQIEWSEDASTSELTATIVAASVDTADLANNAVTDGKLRDSSALSVIGRATNSTGDPADIAASSDGEVLRRSGTALGFGTIGTASIASGFGLIPTGGIIMWSGSIASIPSGWALCDGSGGTPDLTDRFIVGAGDNYAVDATGNSGDATGLVNNKTGTSNSTGTHSHSVTVSNAGSHSHTNTVNNTTLSASVSVANHQLTPGQMPSHTHTYRLGYNFGNLGVNTATGSAGNNEAHGHPGSTASISPASHGHTVTINNGGDHSHPATSGNAGIHSHTTTLDIRPPFYALAFIIKL